MELCTWQHERGALYIVILTDCEGAFSEEQYLALETLHPSEGSAWLGRDIRQMDTGARLDSNLPAMSRVRVWTNSFTMAEHIQQEAIAREGPLHSEEFFFHLLKTVTQDEAPSHATQFAQRWRDTADEELVTLLDTFAAAAYREPDLAEELDRADEAVEAEEDEETPSSAQRRRLEPTTIWRHRQLENSVVPAKWSQSTGSRQMGKTLFQMFRVRSTTNAENSASSSFAEMLPFQPSFVASTRWKFGTRWTEKTQSEHRTSSVMGHVTNRAHAGRT